MDKMLRPTLVLLIITFVISFCIAMANYLTRDTIAMRRQQEVLEERRRVLSTATEFRDVSKYISMLSKEQSDIINDAYAGYKDNELVGYVFSVAPKGYGGKINITVGILKTGEISKVVMGQNKETPGLGTLASKDNFIGQYVGKSIKQNLKIVKKKPTKEDQIQTVSGATISSAAVNSAVNASIDFANKLFENGGIDK